MGTRGRAVALDARRPRRLPTLLFGVGDGPRGLTMKFFIRWISLPWADLTPQLKRGIDHEGNLWMGSACSMSSIEYCNRHSESPT